MIVKFLKKSATFKGVSYNTDKVEKDRGELMLVKNFGALQALDQLRPTDYINYLEAVSTRSSRTKYPQLHVVISAKGKSHTNEELTSIAEQWLKGMGYGEQPYLLIFHKDTDNNHIHLVSTRVGMDGKKKSDSFEKLRAYQVLNRIMGIDEKKEVLVLLEKALSYNFSTRPQFMMLLEAQGYSLVLSDDHYGICKYGKELAQISLEKVDAKITIYNKNLDRVKQLRAIIGKYRLKHDPTIYAHTQEQPGGGAKIQNGYSSKLAEVLREKFGIQVLFHSKDNKPPYGYTLIDHNRKCVFKGSTEVMKLAEFILPEAGVNYDQSEIVSVSQDHTMEGESQEVMLQEIHEQTDHPYDENSPTLTDVVFDQPFDPLASQDSDLSLPEINLDIADDIDDEAILGRNRRRQRKARTNSR